jgi:hypothetical protein
MQLFAIFVTHTPWAMIPAIVGLACVVASSLNAAYSRPWLWWFLVVGGLLLLFVGPFLADMLPIPPLSLQFKVGE